MTEPISHGGRLSSWKQIASYLDVSVRTAQNWEKERGMPVHRIPGEGERGSVFAVTAELDAWLLAGGQTDTRSVPDATSESTAVPVPWSSRRFPGRVFAVVGLGIVVVLAVATFLMSRPVDPVRGELSGKTLIVYGEDGEELFRKVFAELGLLGYTDAGGKLGRELRLADVDGDGVREVFFVARTVGQVVGSDEVWAWDWRGREIWEKPLRLGREIKWKQPDRVREFSEGFSVAESSFLVLEHGAEHYLAVSSEHAYFPLQLLLVKARTGEIVGETVHPGQLNKLDTLDVDGDGTKELIFAGINNPGPGGGHPAFGVIRIDDLIGATVDAEDPFGFEKSPVWRYVLFSRTDVYEDVQEVTAADFHLTPDQLLRVDVVCDPGCVFFYLDRNFKLAKVEGSSDFAVRHRQEKLKGRLDHFLTPEEIHSLKILLFEGRYPNGNSEEVWAALGGDLRAH